MDHGLNSGIGERRIDEGARRNTGLLWHEGGFPK